MPGWAHQGMPGTEWDPVHLSAPSYRYRCGPCREPVENARGEDGFELLGKHHQHVAVASLRPILGRQRNRKGTYHGPECRQADAPTANATASFLQIFSDMNRTKASLMAVVAGVALAGCATLSEIAALRRVDFSLSGTTGTTLAGVPIEQARSIDDLRTTDVVRIGAALARGELPLESDLLVEAANPADGVQARLLELDWTLFLEDEETVSGVLDREFVLPPGDPVTIPVRVRLDLLDFFDGSTEELVDLALALAGAEEPQEVRLEAIPSIQTPLGPMRYPSPIRIEHEVGSVID
jgi:hypothetical protein